ncbi:hypothetical protein [Streptomyces sp.]|uniref:hypothetical protein n=1 Tax=Streptomyces sp. TaxID=1931 RepID=UPI002D793375|nr:hypothetical protein [Streptomyces sp.]HET6354248.1 hypothetical protein [Streptomyces sp.]
MLKPIVSCAWLNRRLCDGHGLLLGVFSDLLLIPALAVILLVSAVKLARHD